MSTSTLVQTASNLLSLLKLHFYKENSKNSSNTSSKSDLDNKTKLLDRQNWSIEGSDKLYRRIEQEIKFLNQNPESLSSNISSLKEIVEYGIKNKENLVAFLRPYSNSKEDLNQNIDLIFTKNNPKSFKSKQLVWTKLIARKGTSIHEHCLGRSDSKNRNILDQAIDIAKLSESVKYNFSSVEVNFVFTRGVTETVKEVLESKLNINCLGDDSNSSSNLEILPDPYDTDRELILEEFFDEEDENYSITPVPNFHFYNSDKVNLDVTTMLSYCTNLTHGSETLNWESQKFNFIANQAQDERKSKVKPIIDGYLENKKLIITQTALNEFNGIINKVAGPQENIRAQNLIKICEIIDDNPSDESLLLPVSSKMSDRSVNIFGTADRLNIPTVTGNIGFVRAAGQNGVDYCVLTHEPRVLTEQKEEIYFTEK